MATRLEIDHFPASSMRPPISSDHYRARVDDIIRRNQWMRKVRGKAAHQMALAFLGRKFAFPNIVGLIGEHAPFHLDRDGYLTRPRIAELALMGVFRWQGLLIARHPDVFGFTVAWHDFRGYTLVPRWKPTQKGWYILVEDVGADVMSSLAQKPNYLGLARRFRCVRLERHLLGNGTLLPPRKQITHQDGNIYNCDPENLAVGPAWGRRMRCGWCRFAVTRTDSVRLRIAGSSIRVCRACLEHLEFMPNYKRP